MLCIERVHLNNKRRIEYPFNMKEVITFTLIADIHTLLADCSYFVVTYLFSQQVNEPQLL